MTFEEIGISNLGPSVGGKVRVAKRSGRVIVKVNHMAKDIKSVISTHGKTA